MKCSKCGSLKFRKHGMAFRDGVKVQKHQCKKCGTVKTEK